MNDTNASLLESPAYRLQQAARAHRSFTLAEIVIAAINAALVATLRTYARYRQYRKASAIRDVLRDLDDRTLRDIGIDRSEIASVAAELTGQAEPSRMHPWRAAQELPAAWKPPAVRLAEPIGRSEGIDRPVAADASRRGALRDAVETRRQLLLALELETMRQAPPQATPSQDSEAIYSG
ncbi:MAG TPA: DUF1127 domain-containing protein [Casimicrobiaceae bacterium]|nr:DUF1127 domain-containing protein [Casimicrobiaceae bacterium]